MEEGEGGRVEDGEREGWGGERGSVPLSKMEVEDGGREGERMSSRPTIFTMYEDNRAYKAPKHFFLSIGLYFSRNTHYLEDIVLNLVLQRTNSSAGDIVEALRSVAMEVRDRYERGNIPLRVFENNNGFVTTLVRDGCFVIELMHIMTTEAHPFRTMAARLSGTIYPTNTTRLPHILLDLFMIKNQIPLSFLQSLYMQLQYEPLPFETLINKFLDFYLMQEVPVPNLASACHLLDAARKKFLLSPSDGADLAPIRPRNLGQMSVCYSATDLKDSGVTILRAADGMVTWDDKRKWRPLLKLPHILINRDSNFIFRNIVAYEQRLVEDDDHPVQPPSAYLRLLSNLVLTAADARDLISKGIVDNQLGSLQDVVEFFKDLKLEDTYGIDMLSKIRVNINQHCKKAGISCWADLRRTYFRSPWSYCSLGAAILLLILTLLQVIYAMLAYHHQQ